MTTRTPIYLLAVLTFACAPYALAQGSHAKSHIESDAGNPGQKPHIESDAGNAGQKPHIESDAGNAGQYAREDAHFFRLDFAVEERDGTRVVNHRDYRTTVATDDISSLRTGDRVPIITSPYKGDQEYQYIDMGVKFDVSGAELQDDGLAVKIALEINSMPEITAPTSGSIIRDQQWKSRVLLPFNKPTTVYTSDDANSHHTLALVVTPTLLR